MLAGFYPRLHKEGLEPHYANARKYAEVSPKNRGSALVYAGEEAYRHQGTQVINVRGLHGLLAAWDAASRA
ncbi:MAG: hypothetical protein PHU21_04525 [Elusimicrobia bacterium]|nr:hypothetical protein [Elusimicrobiota bacterium]